MALLDLADSSRKVVKSGITIDLSANACRGEPVQELTGGKGFPTLQLVNIQLAACGVQPGNVKHSKSDLMLA
jgi:hypothetical protein